MLVYIKIKLFFKSGLILVWSKKSVLAEMDHQNKQSHCLKCFNNIETIFIISRKILSCMCAYAHIYLV